MSQDANLQGKYLQVHLQDLLESWSKGRTTLKEIIGLKEEELFTIANQAYHLFLQGKIEEARVLFEGLVSADPHNAYYYRALGAIYWRLQQAGKALRQFGYAIRIAPDETSNYINRAEVYVSEKQFDLAKADLHKALRCAKSNETALTNKAKAILTMIA